MMLKCGAMAGSVAMRSRSASCTVRVTGGTHALAAQMSGETQSALVAQVVLQALVPQMYCMQLTGAGAVHALLVLQVDGPVAISVVLLQVPPAHWVPDGYFWQAPLPLQRPFVPQLEAPWSVHWVVGLGGWPPRIEVQVPTVPERLQELQVPAQALLQQTPCAQKFELHIAAAVHGWPMASLPQLVPVQLAGEVQSVLLPHVVLQVPPVPQAYGSQRVEVTVLHDPAPSQKRAGVSVSPTQVPDAHCVPVPYS